MIIAMTSAGAILIGIFAVIILIILYSGGIEALISVIKGLISGFAEHMGCLFFFFILVVIMATCAKVSSEGF